MCHTYTVLCTSGSSPCNPLLERHISLKICSQIILCIIMFVNFYIFTAPSFAFPYIFTSKHPSINTVLYTQGLNALLRSTLTPVIHTLFPRSLSKPGGGFWCARFQIQALLSNPKLGLYGYGAVSWFLGFKDQHFQVPIIAFGSHKYEKWPSEALFQTVQIDVCFIRSQTLSQRTLQRTSLHRPEFSTTGLKT